MKKYLAMMLALIMCFAFTACGSDDSGSTDSGDSAEVEESAEQTADDSAFEEIVLFDTDEATMKVTGYDPDSMWGFELKIYCENKTDKTLMFAVDDASVNGYMMDPAFATEVAAGKKENTEMTWYTDDLETNGIESVEDIEMKITVYDSDDWEAAYLIDDTYTVKIPQ